MEIIASAGMTAAPARTSRWQAQSRNNDELSLNRRSALVADDDPDSREALAMILRWCGYDVHLAADGQQAVQVAEEYRPELIFLDIGMPYQDGYEVCRRLRRKPEFEHARIVAVSGFSGETHDTRCSEAGFTAQMPKPIEPTALEEFTTLSEGNEGSH